MSLPKMNDNYLKDLGFYTDTLFRETDPYGAINLIDSNSGGSIGETYLSNNRDLARGQGNNKGLLLEFNSKGLQGQVNTFKPGWDAVYNQGNAEFIAKHNPKQAYIDNIKSIEITGKLPKNAYAIRLRNMLLKNPEWVKTITDSGTVKFIKSGSKTLMGLPLNELTTGVDYLPVLDLVISKDKQEYQKKLQKMFKDAGIQYNNGQFQL